MPSPYEHISAPPSPSLAPPLLRTLPLLLLKLLQPPSAPRLPIPDTLLTYCALQPRFMLHLRLSSSPPHALGPPLRRYLPRPLQHSLAGLLRFPAPFVHTHRRRARSPARWQPHSLNSDCRLCWPHELVIGARLPHVPPALCWARLFETRLQKVALPASMLLHTGEQLLLHHT